MIECGNRAVTHSTKKDLAYEHIRRQILGKRLLPGQRITASQIAAEIGTSVLPVREALLSLEADRLVTITPYVGAVVASVPADAILDLIRILAVLEGYATAEAFERTPLAPHLGALNVELRRAAHGDDLERVRTLDREFHFAIFEACGNERLLATLRSEWSQLDAMLVASSFGVPAERTADDVVEHDHLIHLLADPAASRIEVELAARRHRLRAADRFHEHRARPSRP
jgi:DNA-binding GntR family transcriptional regulator